MCLVNCKENFLSSTFVFLLFDTFIFFGGQGIKNIKCPSTDFGRGPGAGSFFSGPPRGRANILIYFEKELASFFLKYF